MNLTDLIQSSLGDNVTRQLQEKYGLSSQQSRDALDKIAPLVLSGLRKEALSGGTKRVEEILNAKADSDGVDAIDAYFSNKAGAMEDRDAGLDGILGDSGHQASQLLDEKLGLASGMGAKLIPVLAPLILGVIAKQMKNGIDLGALTKMLDRDGDGSILDDVANMFGGGKGGKSLASGCLGMVFARLLKGGAK